MKKKSKKQLNWERGVDYNINGSDHYKLLQIAGVCRVTSVLALRLLIRHEYDRMQAIVRQATAPAKRISQVEEIRRSVDGKV